MSRLNNPRDPLKGGDDCTHAFPPRRRRLPYQNGWAFAGVARGSALNIYRPIFGRRLRGKFGVSAPGFAIGRRSKGGRPRATELTAINSALVCSLFGAVRCSRSRTRLKSRPRTRRRAEQPRDGGGPRQPSLSVLPNRTEKKGVCRSLSAPFDGTTTQLWLSETSALEPHCPSSSDVDAQNVILSCPAAGECATTTIPPANAHLVPCFGLDFRRREWKCFHSLASLFWSDVRLVSRFRLAARATARCSGRPADLGAFANLTWD